MGIFFQKSIKDEHKIYARIRDTYNSRREIIEKLWNIYQPYAPKDFLNNAQRDFYQRWWEMYCGVGLLNLDIPIQTDKNDKGPDFKIKNGDKTIWIEACAPNPGESAECLPEFNKNVDLNELEKKFLLRIRSAIFDKTKKYNEYFNKGIVNTEDCYIIAVSAAALNFFGTFMNSGCTAPLKFLVGAGFLVIEQNGSYYSLRNDILKSSGNVVDVKVFYNIDYETISAVLYSYHDPWSEMTENPENSFQLFINPNAKNSLDYTVFNGIEIWNEFKRDDKDIIWKKKK